MNKKGITRKERQEELEKVQLGWELYYRAKRFSKFKKSRLSETAEKIV